MAKGRSARGQRESSTFASLVNRLLSPRPSAPLLSSVYRPHLALDEVEDGRQWHPDPDRGAMSVGGRYARVIAHQRPLVARANTIFSPSSYPVGLQVPVGVRFESPFRVVTCLRRKVRREIMFATRNRKKGAAQRTRHRTWRSDVSC